MVERLSSLWSVLGLVGVFGCGPSTAEGTGSAGGHGGGTSAADTTGEATAPTGGAPTSGGSTSGGACPPDGADEGAKLDLQAAQECDLFAQDCDAGSKCVPRGHAIVECVAQDADALPDGEACEPSDRSDPCGPTSWCALDPGGATASCTPMCTGSFADPVCPSGRVCIIDDEAVVAECQIACDPFDPNACGEGTCQPTARGFGCLQQGVQTEGAQCFEDDSCVGGLVCAPGPEVAGCCDDGCCARYCRPDQPCPVGSCAPLVPPVPGAEDVGYCATG